MRDYRIVIRALTAVAFLLVSCTSPAAPRQAAPASPSVPPESAALYAAVENELADWERSFAARPRSSPVPVFGAHLLPANANRGTDLLVPATMDVVDMELERLKALGVQGVTVTISFPLFEADQPRSADFISFYETVAKHVRERGLAFAVEQHVAFSGTPFSSVHFDFSTLPFDRFVERDREMTRTILTRLRPDHLTVLSEPDTFARLTGYTQVATPSGAAAMVARIIADQPRGVTKVAAGAGSWLPNAVDFDRAFAAAGIDEIDLHVYPLTPVTIGITERVVDAARELGKPIVLDEAWLTKIAAGERLPQGWAREEEIYRRDEFSFWAPLDARFLTDLAGFAARSGVAYVSPFWTGHFWGYTDHGPDTKDAARERLARSSNQATLQALRAGTFTVAGTAWGEAIASEIAR